MGIEKFNVNSSNRFDRFRNCDLADLSLYLPLSHNIGLEFMQKPSSAFFFFENFAQHEGISSSSTQFSYHVEILRLFQNSHAPIVRRKEQKHSSQAGIKAGQREKICVCRKKRKARQRRGKKGGEEEISVTRWRQLWVRHGAADDDEYDTTPTRARVLTNFPFFCTAVRRESCREKKIKTFRKLGTHFTVRRTRRKKNEERKRKKSKLTNIDEGWKPRELLAAIGFWQLSSTWLEHCLQYTRTCSLLVSACESSWQTCETINIY